MSDISVFRNDGHTIDLTFTDDAGAAIDITLWTVWMTAKRNRDDEDGDAMFQKTVTVHSDPTNGITQIVLLPADLSDDGSFFYDIQIKKGAGLDPVTVTTGLIRINKDVTLIS